MKGLSLMHTELQLIFCIAVSRYVGGTMLYHRKHHFWYEEFLGS